MRSMAAGPLAGFLLMAPAVAQDRMPAPICTDRPTKANAVCTVPARAVQVEAVALGVVRTDTGTARTDVWTIGGMVVKIGLDDRSDLQVGVSPYVLLDARQEGKHDRTSGLGDIVVRYKRRLTDDDSAVQIALIPFVKLPTAKRSLGNGKVEGGLAVPVSKAVGKMTLTFGPELDLLADANGNGRHLALVNLINLAIPAASRVTLVGKLWTATSFDPDGTTTAVSADGALAYAVTETLQLDVGANVGLNRRTPDVEAYAGISVRF